MVSADGAGRIKVVCSQGTDVSEEVLSPESSEHRPTLCVQFIFLPEIGRATPETGDGQAEKQASGIYCAAHVGLGAKRRAMT